LHQAGCDWSDDRAEASRCDTGCKKPGVGDEEVGRPPDVLVPPVMPDRVEAVAGAGGERERANDAGYDLVGDGDIPLAKTREHRELRIEARTMTARPAAARWFAASDTEHLADRRVLCQHHPLAAGGRPELRRRLRRSVSRSGHEQGQAAEQRHRFPDAHRPQHDTIVTRLRLAHVCQDQALVGRREVPEDDR
jgi:hypothetical protein